MRARLGFGARQPSTVRRPDRDVAQHREVREQLEVLEHHPHAAAQLAHVGCALMYDRPPSNRTRPPSIRSSALAQRSSVDLPEPDGPIRHTTSPRLTWKRDAVERLQRAVALDDTFEGQDRRSGAADARSRARADSRVHSTTL